MKNLNQLKSEFTVTEQLKADAQQQITGGIAYFEDFEVSFFDDKRRERPGSTAGN